MWVEADHCIRTDELRHRLVLESSGLDGYDCPGFDRGEEKGIDGEDFLLIHAWLEEIGFFEAVRTRKTYASLMRA